MIYLKDISNLFICNDQKQILFCAGGSYPEIAERLQALERGYICCPLEIKLLGSFLRSLRYI